MNNIHSRLERLMRRIADEHKGNLTVTFADGTRRIMDGGECVNLVYTDTDKIGRFEGGDGHLADLLNGLLEV